ncbi:unnamed protein product, partial [Rotaria magnacalcarata]
MHSRLTQIMGIHSNTVIFGNVAIIAIGDFYQCSPVAATVGRLHRISCPNCQGQDTICVIRENDTIDQQDNDFRSNKGTKQFPLRLSWAMTIHKAQGITVDQVAISTKDMFGTGM